MDAAEKSGVRIYFQKRCMEIDLRSGSLRLRDEESREEMQVETDVVIGCDGSASAIRSEMLRRTRFNFSQHYLDYGYKELTIPAGPAGRHVLETNALHIWPRGNYMLIALPNIDGTFACILFLPFEGNDSFAELKNDAAVDSFFSERFPDALPLMPGLAANFFENPTGAMVTVKCAPWHVEGRALLLGDAAHAIVPFFGQGINCGFEDCTVLLELIDRHGADWKGVFQRFEQSRKANTDAIADLAVENFVEMRDRVGDPRFLFRKKVELALEAKYPGVFVPKYAMVTFHRVPYSTALSRGEVQDRMLSELCRGVDRLDDLDWKKADQLIRKDLAPLELSA
jgi:kynurenine 3-monooxygenase